jgi:hypothetical protein
MGDRLRLALAIVVGLYLGAWIVDYWLWMPLLLGGGALTARGAGT